MANYTIQDNTANVNQLHDALIRQDPAMNQAVVESNDGGFLSITWVSQATTQQDIVDAIAQQDTLSTGVTSNTIQVTPINQTPAANQETVITCPELSPLFDYRVFLNGTAEVNEDGVTGSVDDGTLEFSSNDLGTFEIEIIDPNGYSTGWVTIQVVE